MQRINNLPPKGYSAWDDHPEYTRERWRDEVVRENTQRGYWEWVKVMLEDAEHDARTS